jgi:hypothetical protein
MTDLATSSRTAGRAGLGQETGAWLALAASALAAVATAISSLDGDADLVPFFVLLTFAGGLIAVLLQPPVAPGRRTIARFLALGWAGAAIWAGVLLVWYQTACGCSSPPPAPDALYAGIPASAFHLAAAFVGGALVMVAAFGSPSRGEPRS